MIDRHALLRRLTRLLGPERIAALGLGEGPVTGRLPRWLRSLAEAADALPLPEVPTVVSQDLHALFELRALVEAQEAVLIRDTRYDGDLVGVRGAGVGEGWSMFYASELADIVLDVWPNPTGSFSVEGHVMEHRGASSAYRVRVSGPVETSVDGDRLGRFHLPALPAGTYTIVARNVAFELALSASLGEAEG